jgi:hypothetical protein
LPHGEKLVWRIFFLHFISSIFNHQSFAPIGLQKTNPASGWWVKNLSDAVTETLKIIIWLLRNITNPAGWDSVKMC